MPSEDAASRLEAQDYYYGMLGEEDLVDYLHQSGDFLVRCVDNNRGMEIVISYKTDRTNPTSTGGGMDSGNSEKEVRHAILRFDSNRKAWHLKKHKTTCFPRIEQLIDYYRHHELPSGGKLLRGSLRPNWHLRHSQVKFNKEKDLLGSGNFCDVYRGIFKGREEVAVKVCQSIDKKEGVDHREEAKKAMAALLEEGKIMSQINHTHIIKFLGLCCDQPPVMILMELCVRPLLGHLQKTGDAILPGERIKYIVDVSEGMMYLQSKNLVHRDLAARNCLFNKRGICKIADFGLSKLVRNLVGETVSNAQMPVRWMAPETLCPTPHFSVKSDVWAFGVLSYEVFSNGTKPFDGDDWIPKRIATHIRRGKMPDPPEKTPPHVASLMKQCWALDPDERIDFIKINKELKRIWVIYPAPDCNDQTLASVPGIVMLTPEELALIEPEMNIVKKIEHQVSKIKAPGPSVSQQPDTTNLIIIHRRASHTAVSPTTDSVATSPRGNRKSAQQSAPRRKTGSGPVNLSGSARRRDEEESSNSENNRKTKQHTVHISTSNRRSTGQRRSHRKVRK
uniref:Tyrosine-protein kinase n=1 Tax=Panagrellus redivivus TaxID=6233 RepID=A0A7E4ZYH9_PANRE